jgi:hypothetical protein
VKPGEFRALRISRSLLENLAERTLARTEKGKTKETKGASFELEAQVLRFRVRDLVRRGSAHGKIRRIVWL